VIAAVARLRHVTPANEEVISMAAKKKAKKAKRTKKAR
jgi:hypothetical protein